ncbi:PSD1 and planctomycete cytochrome C domain-containing protein [Tundrisphaera sp. TA3]|uniref:PSD1 and planctomycete cytochrome C domain-containing protein n=1 Tax=Tundrisphaera sp. TA3 TaxID=3435775 RepID=UPI003EBE2B20
MRSAQRRGSSVGLALLACLASARLAPGAGPAPDGKPSSEAAAFFESKVRPVLVEHCAKCHGEAKQSGGLRVDSRAAMLEGGDGGPAIVPGEPDKSMLVLAARHEGDIKMPPKGAKLDAPAVEALGQWVRMGAPWPEGVVLSAEAKEDASKTHWSYQPIRDPAPPAVKSAAATVASPIDAFLVAALEAKGIAPSPAASKRTLIRRATFDLHGLPPTAAEVDAFLADSSPDAFNKVVDRLLASPRYGERWGRHWLDVARYADTKGYVFTAEGRYPYSYTYRDYVIRAFNEDRPYDRFILEQIAADKLGLGEDNRALAGLGFLTVGRRYLNNNEDVIDDRIDVVTRGFLGLGVACARCHDHKFDPIPTEDYYSLHGVFASSVEPEEPPLISPADPNPARADYDKERAAREKAAEDDLNRLRARIDAEIRRHLAKFVAAAFDLDFQPRGPKLDEAARAQDVSPERLRWVAPRLGKILAKSGDGHDPILAPWRAFAALPPAEFAAKAAEVKERFSKPDPALPLDPNVLRLVADEPAPASLRDVALRYGALFERAARSGPVPPEFVGPPEVLPDPSLEPVRALLARADGGLSVPADQARRVLNRAEREANDNLAKKVGELDVTHPGSPARAMVMVDAPKPVEPHVYIRGNPGRPGKTIPRRFLRVLSEGGEAKPFDDGSGRLGLARAIASPKNPLTARVMVNRIWMHHFGSGLVLTPSDYGLRGEPPTNPDLLDFLASRFIQGGWSIKAMHRMIMASAAYQQASDRRPEAEAIDPSNRLVWRQERRRLDFEAMRDSILAASGQLDPAMGGRSVRLFTGQAYATRRSVYGYTDRLDLDPTLPTFDVANPDAHAPVRPQTTVPQQALFLMNSPFLLDQAKALAHRPDIEALPEAEARIHRLYADLFGRPPEPREVELGRAFVAAPRPEGDKSQGTTPWEEYAQVLLLANEFLFVD